MPPALKALGIVALPVPSPGWIRNMIWCMYFFPNRIYPSHNNSKLFDLKKPTEIQQVIYDAMEAAEKENIKEKELGRK
ncbi:hypothetical protein AHMF7605_12825 [Adhaeribacter arboris]|uniref:Uncharacterized protein n=1 Tax=Adhaeribacter arboris TaxID=2072846 RepID=A0A2T2YFN4_9BACT|nr:hypothetical protein AHMF7605_12825 [Adhaeribacter arboris]